MERGDRRRETDLSESEYQQTGGMERGRGGERQTGGMERGGRRRETYWRDGKRERRRDTDWRDGQRESSSSHTGLTQTK